MIASAYTMNADSDNSTAFLKSLNNINGSSFKLLVKKIITFFNSNDKDLIEFNYDLIYKLILLICINGDTNSANELISEFLVISIQSSNSNSSVETLLNKLRQEINPFHPDSFMSSIKSVLESLQSSKNEAKMNSFVNNLISIHEWDTQNQFFIR